MKQNNLSQVLRDVSFLRGMAPEHVDQIAKLAQLCEFEKGELIFDEGQIADSLYLIVSGKVMLEVSTKATGRKQILTVCKGELLGWSAWTDEHRYSAKGVVIEPLQVVQIDGAGLRAICEKDPKLGYEFLRRTMIALARRLTTTWRQLAELYVAHYVTTPIGAAAQND